MTGMLLAVVAVAVMVCPAPALGAPSGVVHAQNWTGDPAAGGTMIAEEWLQLGLAPGAESVRRQTADGIVTTRSDVPCVDGSSLSGLCPEVREVSLPSGDGAIKAAYSRDRGAYLGDPNVPQPSDLAQTATAPQTGVQPASTGPLAQALGSWQTPPPGHGSTFERFDVATPGGVDSEWLDGTTHLPLKITVTSNGTQQSTYWTYTPGLIAPTALGHDFFLQPAPADPGQSQQTRYYAGGQLPPAVADRAAKATFAPLTLGRSATVNGQGLCLAGVDKFDYADNAAGFADPQDSSFTRVDEAYVPSAAGAACRPGRGRAGDAAVEISSFAEGSPIAAANRQAFAGAQPMSFQLTHAALAGKHARAAKPVSVTLHVMPGASGTQALGLADVGGTTVLIRSDLPGPSGSSNQVSQVVSNLLVPMLVRRGYKVRARPPARAAEDITSGHWLFTGSIYDQSSGTPNRNKRLDPVSVIWKGGGQASIWNVRAYTQAYWKESAIPHGYPGGKEMKPRDDNPLCRDAHYVWFRYTGNDPNRGKWEQSDPHGYMSTNGLCANQYHIRMWSSRALYDLTGAHLYEFVLAPIHHDHTKVCWIGPIPYPCHGRPDLSFDKARYAYAKVMSQSVCTFIHWRVNPESEGYNYQGYVYSGYVSRITFWLVSRHPTCRGV